MQAVEKRETRTPTGPDPYEQDYHRPKITATTPRKVLAGLYPRLMASLFLVEEAVLDGVVPALPGLATLPAHWYLPLMTLFAPVSALNVAQSVVRSPVDWMLKAPRLSLSAGRETLHYVSHCRQSEKMLETYWVKFPYMSVAPPTVSRAGKTIEVKRVLFWTWRPPVIDLREAIVTLVNWVLVLMAKVPPTEVKFGAVRPVMEFS